MRTLAGANKDQRLAARYIPKDARCVLEHTNGSACYVYEAASKFYALAFWGTAGRSLWHIVYKTEAQRDAAVWAFRQSVESSLTLRADQAAKRLTPHTFKAGDIVNTSWGYDQTNVDFYVITRVTARCVWVRPIASDYEATGFMAGQCWPAMPIRTTGPETKHVASHGSFSIDGHSTSLTKGTQYSSSYA